MPCVRQRWCCLHILYLPAYLYIYYLWSQRHVLPWPTHLYLLSLKIAQNRITQKRNNAILREMKFANDCAKCFFSAQKCSATKALAFAKIAQKFCEWKP